MGFLNKNTQLTLVIFGLLGPIIILLGHLIFNLFGLLSTVLFCLGWLSVTLMTAYYILIILGRIIPKIEKSLRLKGIVIVTIFSFATGIGVSYFVHAKTSNYFISKLEKEGILIEGRIVDEAYWNGHMIQGGWDYEYFVNDVSYTGTVSEVDRFSLGSRIQVKCLKNWPWIRRIYINNGNGL